MHVKMASKMAVAGLMLCSKARVQPFADRNDANPNTLSFGHEVRLLMRPSAGHHSSAETQTYHIPTCAL